MIVSKSYQWSEAGARLLSVIGILGLLATATNASAQGMGSTLQVHGFLSQALVITDDNDFFGPSSESGGSTQFTEVGVNFSVRPYEDILVAAQVLSRRAGGDGSEAQPELDYGVIDYQVFSNQKRNIGLQLGRFKNPFGFYNQTRDVAFTRPSILLPQSIYFDRTRTVGLAGDGATLYAEERLSSGNIRAQLGLGEAQLGEDVDRTLGFGDRSGSFDSESSLIAQLRYEHDAGRIISAISVGHAKADYESNDSNLNNGKLNFQPWVFSVQYNSENWSLTGEYAVRKTELYGFNEPRNFSSTGNSWYLQYIHRLRRDWQWLVRYDSLISNRDDPSGKHFESSGAGPAHSQFAKDWTMGLQWQPYPKVLISAEYHYINGTGWIPIQDNPDASNTSQYWNMFLAQFSVRF
jgi:opacity protein-like surface antigen